jgi:hypothetical protein
LNIDGTPIIAKLVRTGFDPFLECRKSDPNFIYFSGIQLDRRFVLFMFTRVAAIGTRPNFPHLTHAIFLSALFNLVLEIPSDYRCVAASCIIFSHPPLSLNLFLSPSASHFQGASISVVMFVRSIVHFARLQQQALRQRCIRRSCRISQTKNHLTMYQNG